MREERYAGYRIKFHCTSEWFAHIYRPNSNVAMAPPIITATREEGETVLLLRVKNHINQDIADSRGKP